MKVVVFAGTSEGRKLCEQLTAINGARVIACVATEYGAALLPGGLHVLKGRMDEADMEALFAREQPDAVVDATHPFAREVTQSIRDACERTNTRRFRLLREADAHTSGVPRVPSAEAAAAMLKGTRGNILLATGVKSIPAFAENASLRPRLYARILPMVSSLQQCLDTGIEPSHIIAMHGPFSAGMNAAIFRQYDIRHLVTKDSGAAGGLPEKLAAAAQLRVDVIAIERPAEDGLSYRQILSYFTKELGL